MQNEALYEAIALVAPVGKVALISAPSRQHANKLMAALDGCNGEELGVNVASVSFKGATTVTDSGNSASGADGCLFVDVMPIAAGLRATWSGALWWVMPRASF